MQRVAFMTLGCKTNQYDAEYMREQFLRAGYAPVDFDEIADVYVVNTCMVTATGERKSLKYVRQAARRNPQADIVVTGCVAQHEGEKLALPGVRLIVGNARRREVVPLLERARREGRALCAVEDLTSAPFEPLDVLANEGHTRAVMKIQEGCDNRCAYCIIPMIRGRFRSRPEEAILAEAENLAQAGMKELIVVAQDITRYGLDLYGRRTLAQLLPKLCAIEGIQWVRLHYLYPDEITDELIDVIAREPKIVKYLDIPIQHISDRVLRAMHRRGTGQEIRTLFRKLRERIPGLVLRTSLIAGFPGETEEEFEELCEFLLAFRVERAGVFPYSPEPGSAAAAFPDQVDEDVKRRRVELLTDLQMRIVDDYCAAMVGKVLTVLCEGYDEETELFFGRGEADSPGIDGLIHFEGEEGGVRPGEFYSVKITNTYDGELVGVLYEEEEA